MSLAWNNNLINKIVITSGLGAFEFGNTGTPVPVGLSEKIHMTRIFETTLPEFPNYLITGFAKGSLLWDNYELTSRGNSLGYGFGLDGTLNLHVEMT